MLSRIVWMPVLSVLLALASITLSVVHPASAVLTYALGLAAVATAVLSLRSPS